jgi:NAD(P)-dependent dehydrogenase (short-subunit alcohol dehydrogenase family)
MARFMTGFGFASTASEVVAGVDLTGKVMIVTGGAGGIGIETVRAIATAGADVTIAARRADAAREVARDLQFETGNKQISVAPLNVSDPASVAAFVAGWDRPLHALINNAGVMALPTLERTTAGREMQFATNYLGHFALTRGLHPWLRAAGGARVVSVSSTGSLFGSVLWDDPDFRFTVYDPLLAYAQSKTACILMVKGISDRWQADGITANALNPGAIATNLQRHTGGLRTPEHLRKTPEQGAATSVLLAASPLLDGINGRYFDHCNEAEMVLERGTPLQGVAPYALSRDNADRLWDMASTMLASAT